MDIIEKRNLRAAFSSSKLLSEQTPLTSVFFGHIFDKVFNDYPLLVETRLIFNIFKSLSHNFKFG